VPGVSRPGRSRRRACSGAACLGWLSAALLQLAPVRCAHTSVLSSFATIDLTHSAHIGNTLFFRASSAASGTELWYYDGDSGVGGQVADIYSGSSSSNPSSFCVVHSEVWFAANNGVNGVELMRLSTATMAASLKRDVWSGSFSSTPAGMMHHSASGKVFFGADSGGGNGRELHVHTIIGNTFTEVSINAGSTGSDPAWFTPLSSSQVAFVATTATAGRELWTFNTVTGTLAGTDVLAGSSSSDPSDLIAFNSVVVFAATRSSGRELFSLSAGGVVAQLSDIASGAADSK